jgi:cysteine desulfurase
MSPQAVYLDNNATTRISPAAMEAVRAASEADFGNPSSVHDAGTAARYLVEKARAEVAALAGCGDDEVCFTSGGTEANNIAVQGLPWAARDGDGGGQPRLPVPHIVTTAIEHPSVRMTAWWLGEAERVTVSFAAPSPDGVVGVGAILAAMTPDTRLVSVMLANNETGAVQPVREIVAAVRARSPQCFLHCDAVQLAGKLPISFNELGVDALSLAAHKLHGPKGVGALIIRKGVRVPRLMHGGGQENGMRSGTLNTPGIAGFGVAAREARAGLAAYGTDVAALRDRLRDLLVAGISGALINSNAAQTLPNTLNISIPGIVSGDAVRAMADRGISISAASACAAGNKLTHSHVLLAMGFDEARAASSLRFSLSRHTTRAEIEFAAKAMIEVAAQLRAKAGQAR